MIWVLLLAVFFFWVFFFSLFPNGFLLCDHELDLWDRLMCEFNQSINQYWKRANKNKNKQHPRMYVLISPFGNIYFFVFLTKVLSFRVIRCCAVLVVWLPDIVDLSFSFAFYLFCLSSFLWYCVRFDGVNSIISDAIVYHCSTQVRIVF